MTGVLTASAASAQVALQREQRSYGKLAGLAAELALLLVVIYYFQLESQGFFRLAALGFAGFLVHYFLPFRLRLPFFLGLSLAGIGLVLGGAGAWLVAVGLALIGICHLPISFRARVAALGAAAILMALLRANWMTAPWPAAIWPILASMFMFRLILYMNDTKHEAAPASWWQRLSYFFLLPNVCFTMFPVIDYKTFGRTYYNEERHRTYQVGVIWIFRGLAQLVLYRIVYYYVSMAPTEVEDLGDLVRYIVSAILLYLRISGQFHVIVGMLRLYGFNLPETHHLYFLSTSFTDFWRRINIYWKDFMMKTFFYPLFFKLRKRGETTALLASTALVFFATWALHAYQWFWIRGSYLLAWHDVLFWGILAVLVMVNTLYEARHGRQRLAATQDWTLKRALGLVARTAGTFAVISLIWSLWTSASVGEWVAVWSTALQNPTVADARLIPAALVAVVGFAVVTLVMAARERDRLRPQMAFGRSVGTVLASGVALCLFGTPELYARYLPGGISYTYAQVVGSTREVRLSGHDADMLERGYYEDLLNVQNFNSQLWEVYSSWPLNWSRIEDTGAIRLTGDFLKQELVPSKEVHFRNATLTTNRWGMRDRDYEERAPEDTYRFAIVGSSHVMGYGVDDGRTFEALVEDRLNSQMRGDPYQTYEILNFAVDGYNPMQELFQVEHRVFKFSPDALLYVVHYGAPHRAAVHLVDMVKNGVEIPYPELRDILQRAGVDANTSRFEGEQRLMAFQDEILSWAYHRMVDISRQHGAVPIWVYLPTAGEYVSPEQYAGFVHMAEDAGFVIVNLDGCFDEHDPPEIWFGEWDHHPNALGHRLIADRLFRRLSDQRVAVFGKKPAAQLASNP